MKRKELKTELVAIAQRNFYKHKQKPRRKSGLRNAIIAGLVVGIMIPVTIYGSGANQPEEQSKCPQIGNLYPATLVVKEVDYATNIVCIRNANGFEYTFYGVEDWVVGDICSALMDDCGTEIIIDDKVILPIYSGKPDQYILYGHKNQYTSLVPISERS